MQNAVRRPYFRWQTAGSAWLACGLFAIGCAHGPSPKAKETARISYDVGVSAFQRGDGREALRALMAAEKLDPQLAEVHNALGLVYHAHGKSDLALRHYQRALALRPGFSEARNNCGVLLLDGGRYDEAIAAFERTLGDILYASPVLAEGNLGWALYKKGDVAAGKEHLYSALGSDPQFCRGYQWLMRIAVDLDDAPEALSLARRCDKYCGDNGALVHPVGDDFRREIDHLAGLSHLRLGHQNEAWRRLERCAGPVEADYASDSVQARCRASLAALR